MSELVLGGLDGANPLGFLAALGVLNVLSDSGGAREQAKLSWRNVGYWRPVVHGGVAKRDAVVAAIMVDLKTWKAEPALALEYGDSERDLKPPPGEFKAFLRKLVKRAEHGKRRSVDVAAAFATDVARDRAGKTKPTALHFTAGQQSFLAAVHALVAGVTREDIGEAIFGPWRYQRDLPVLRWDATSSRDYALRASDPSKDKPTGVPGADWLAFRGLSFVRVVPRGSKILTTGCFGEWKTGGMRWPLWTVPLGRETVQTVMTMKGLSELQAADRRARGIGVVFEAKIRRSEQGGYGNFSPASVT